MSKSWSSSCFAKLYLDVLRELHKYPLSISCRNMAMNNEICGTRLSSNVSEGISIFSDKDTKAFPIKFAIAEWLWLLTGSNRVDELVKWNKVMAKYSDDNVTLNGAYGYRLGNQIFSCINELVDDMHSRRATAVIARYEDVSANSKDKPCNVFLQFLIRNDRLSLIVTARSIDAFTGLSIDSFHWQMLLHSVCLTLKHTYSNLSVGYFTYQIGSLHVYKTDEELLSNIVYRDGQDCSEDDVKFLLIATVPYDEAVVVAKAGFNDCDSLEDLCRVSGLDFKSCNILQNMFVERKYKMVR